MTSTGFRRGSRLHGRALTSRNTVIVADSVAHGVLRQLGQPARRVRRAASQSGSNTHVDEAPLTWGDRTVCPRTTSWRHARLTVDLVEILLAEARRRYPRSAERFRPSAAATMELAFDSLSIALLSGIVVVSLVHLVLLRKPEPATHPLLLGRQSELNKVSWKPAMHGWRDTSHAQGRSANPQSRPHSCRAQLAWVGRRSSSSRTSSSCRTYGSAAAARS